MTIGMWHLIHSLAPPDGAGTLNLDGQTITKISFNPDEAHAGLKIDNNGNVYRTQDTGVRSWTLTDDATGDWVRPTTEAPGAYQVRYTGLTGVTLSFNTKAEDVWHPLSSGDFILRNSVTLIGDRDSTFTVEIRDGSSGGADVSGTYRLHATVESGA
jgi:hypothetical protein